MDFGTLFPIGEAAKGTLPEVTIDSTTVLRAEDGIFVLNGNVVDFRRYLENTSKDTTDILDTVIRRYSSGDRCYCGV